MRNSRKIYYNIHTLQSLIFYEWMNGLIDYWSSQLNKLKLLQKIFNSQKNVRFDDFVLILEMFDFECDRISGSHRIYKRSGIPELINIQNVNGTAKPYQIKQFFYLIEKYDLKTKEEA